MYRLVLLASFLWLGGCTAPLPAVDSSQAWVDLRAPAAERLVAERLDRQRVSDGRYFQVTPGAHELLVSLHFEISRGGGSGVSETHGMTCNLRIRYDNFQAGQRYRIEARQALMRGYAILYDAQRTVLARSQNLGCRNF
jgi:hypothetical protein